MRMDSRGTNKIQIFLQQSDPETPQLLPFVETIEVGGARSTAKYCCSTV